MIKLIFKGLWIVIAIVWVGIIHVLAFGGIAAYAGMTEEHGKAKGSAEFSKLLARGIEYFIS